LNLLQEAVMSGARQYKACELLGIDERTVQRWRKQPQGEDQRKGIPGGPANKLSQQERQNILEVANSPEYRELSPKQIVPKLADKGEYIGSESSFYRILREYGQMKHRQRAKPPTKTRPKGYKANGPNQLYSWDITYLPTALRGSFFYLYMFMDVWSRKIVGFEVHQEESMALSSRLLRDIYRAEDLIEGQVVVHSDNGGPMKGSTMLATMQSLGVMPSFSRPSISNDNAFSESLFRTLKYRPKYPNRPFENLQKARQWVCEFVRWYNEEHLHSCIGFVTPNQRHDGRSEKILSKRRGVYEKARQKNPRRWSGKCRSWEEPKVVHLNKSKQLLKKKKSLVPSPSAVPSPFAQSRAKVQQGTGTGKPRSLILSL